MYPHMYDVKNYFIIIRFFYIKEPEWKVHRFTDDPRGVEHVNKLLININVLK